MGATAGDGVRRFGGTCRLRLPAHCAAELPAPPRRAGRIPRRVHLALLDPGDLPARPDPRNPDRAWTLRRAHRDDRVRRLPAPARTGPCLAGWSLISNALISQIRGVGSCAWRRTDQLVLASQTAQANTRIVAHGGGSDRQAYASQATERDVGAEDSLCPGSPAPRA